MSDNIEEFRHVLQSSKKILVLSGAGLSAAASGIPTYRGGTGSLWRKYDAASLATPAAFFQRTSLVVLKATSNPGHYVLTRLAIPSIRQKIAPHSELTHVTQNVDGPLTKALDEVQAPLGARDAFCNSDRNARPTFRRQKLFLYGARLLVVVVASYLTVVSEELLYVRVMKRDDDAREGAGLRGHVVVAEHGGEENRELQVEEITSCCTIAPRN